MAKTIVVVAVPLLIWRWFHGVGSAAAAVGGGSIVVVKLVIHVVKMVLVEVVVETGDGCGGCSGSTAYISEAHNHESADLCTTNHHYS